MPGTLTLDVFDAELLDKRRIEDARGKGTPEDVAELSVQSANAHLLKGPVRAKPHPASVMCGARTARLESFSLLEEGTPF